MKVIVNGDDALSAFLAMDAGNPFLTYGISEKVMVIRILTKFARDASARNVARLWNINSIITASLVIMHVQAVILSGRRFCLTLLRLKWGNGFLLQWRAEGLQQIIKDSIMYIISCSLCGGKGSRY